VHVINQSYHYTFQQLKYMYVLRQCMILDILSIYNNNNIILCIVCFWSPINFIFPNTYRTNRFLDNTYV